jgi:Na+/alanine symporter
MINSKELAPVLSAMQEAIEMSIKQTKKVFLTIALFAHGYASIIANNFLVYDEELVASHLEQAFKGAVLAAKENP